jgi:transcriptional regulator with GAF, ATPase, and Fis domain
MVVGSATRADIVVADVTVSRLHAELEPRGDGLWVRDLESRNGTFVDALLVKAARVPPAGHIRLGSTTLTLAPQGQPTKVDLWPEGKLAELVGTSTAMRELFATIVRVGASDAPVLVQGETGTGKELVAQALHECSHRAGHPFVVLDCAALPENLLESELFGHAKGAFTGASELHIGSFEAAQGGTLFLDEIGELPLTMQPRLLRVLESKTVRRVGETGHRPIDVRFIAATHRDLRTLVNGGAFREDLYFRLAVVPVTVPPLRERMEDLPALIEHFAPSMPAQQRADLARTFAERRLEGNVRELRNLVERASLLGLASAVIGSDDHDSVGGRAPPRGGELAFEGPFHDFQRDSEREYLRRLLLRHSGQVSEAAKEAGLNRTYFYRLLRKHAL